MTARMLVQALLLLFIAGGIEGYHYSCEEVRYRLINSNIAQNTSFACVFTQEGFNNWDQLKKIEFAGYSVSLADIGQPSGCISKHANEQNWRLIADQSMTTSLKCDQEFTLVFTSDIPSFEVPDKTPRQARTINRHIFVQPHTFMWFHTENCIGDGKVTLATGAGVGESEQRYDMISWPCWAMPDWIFTFDNVVTIYVEDGVTWNVQFSSEPGGSKNPVKVKKGDNIAILTSGKADDVQNLKGRTDNRAYIQIGNKDNTEVSVDMDITLDTSNTGSITLQKVYAGSTQNYYNGTHTENFNTGYFEIRYEPSGKDAPEIWSSNDNILIDVWIGPKTERTSPSTTTSTTTLAPTTTAKAAATTQPSKPAEDGPYCKCGVDKFGFPAGWKNNDIWLDIIVILDTSEAMGKAALDDASGLIESFIADVADGVDFLITDPTAPFYTRVGVIAMAETATVLYNLNMTATDHVQASIKNGLAQINVVDAFNAAQSMLNGAPKRSNVRQVIYYLTDSDPTYSMSSLYQFKDSGVVIVNNFLKPGENEKDGLKDLASYGFYYSDTNYMLSLQAFCKANCFCNPGRDRLGGSDPAIIAAGGCYHPTPTSVPFSKAKTTCATDGGIVAVVHDEAKGRFVQQEMLKTGTKSDYYWIGYERSNNVWRWQDQSADPYTNWDVDEPSSNSVANCAYVDSAKGNLPWGAGACTVGFPYVCEYPPCSVGNNIC